MKKTLMIFAAIVMMAGFSTTVIAQTNAVVTSAGAQLIVPMTITQTSPLHFGTITLVDATGGTVVLSTAAGRTFTGGVSTTAVSPTATNAAYNVTGTYNETYALTLPGTITVTETLATTGVKTMDISALKVLFNGGTEATAVGATSLLSSTGTDSFIVGGTLTIKADQIGGIYATTFPVSVDYN
jgi:hypothetical protein